MPSASRRPTRRCRAPPPPPTSSAIASPCSPPARARSTSPSSARGRAAYITMAALALVGIVTTLVIAEPEKRVAAGTAEREGKIAQFADRYAGLPPALREALVWIYGAIVCPFVDFFARFRWLAAGPAGLHRPVSPERHRHGRDGQSVLHRHGIQPAADRQRHQDLRLRHVDPGRPAGRRAGVPPGRGAPAGAVGVPDRRQQPHLLVARHHRPARSAGAGDGDQRRQPGERHGGLGLHRLPVGPHQHRLHGDAICAVHLDHDPAGQGDRRLLRRDRRLAAGLGARRAGLCRRCSTRWAPRPSSTASRSSSPTPPCSACRPWCWP